MIKAQIRGGLLLLLQLLALTVDEGDLVDVQLDAEVLGDERNLIPTEPTTRSPTGPGFMARSPK